MNVPVIASREIEAVRAMDKSEREALKQKINGCDPHHIFAAAGESPNPDKRKIICPSCGNGTGEDSTPVEVTLQNGTWLYHCFRCNEFSGDLLKIIADSEKLNLRDFGDMCKALAVGANLIGYPLDSMQKKNHSKARNVSDSSKPTQKCNQEELPLIKSDIAAAQSRLADLPISQRRGLTLETLQYFDCGYLPKWIHPKCRVKTYEGDIPAPSRRIIIPAGNHYNAVALPADRPGMKKKFHKMHAGKMQLFNSPALQEAEIILVVEGEFDAMSIWQANGGNVAVVAVLGVDNRNVTLRPLLKTCVGKKFLILFDGTDNSNAGRNAADKLRAELLKKKFPAACRFFDDFLSGEEKKSFGDKSIDANEILQSFGDEFLRTLTEKIIDDARADLDTPPPATDDEQQEKFSWTQDKIKSCPVNLKLPNDYIFSLNGITKIIPPRSEHGKPKYIVVSHTPIIPTKKFREPVKGTLEYGISVFSDDEWRNIEVDAAIIGDIRELSKILNRHGGLVDEPKIISQFINATIALNHGMQRIQAYNKTGWTDDTYTKFIYPHSEAPYIVRRAGFDFDKTLATRGDAELWKQKFLEVLEKGGAVVYAYIGTALASPLARPLNIINPQAHLQGTSGGGKTALQKFTASTFGNPRELLRNFAATNKNRQLFADAFCDLPSFYDELETIQGKAAEETLSNDVYNFADGKGNQANKRDGTARETFRFGGARLTTGERPILKQHDQRGAYKRLMQFNIQGKLFDDEFAADLHIFSESNFGHYAFKWIQFVQEHMKEIQAAYQNWAKSDPTTKNYEPTHLKTLAASLVAVEFFKVMLGVNSKYDAMSLVRNRRIILDTQLPTLSQIDDTARALKDLSSYVAAHEKSFNRPHKDSENGKIEEIAAWGTACFGKIFDTGEVAFHPTELKRILEDDLHYASADKLINEWNSQGNILITDKGRTTHVIRIDSKTYRTIHFSPNVISTDIDSAEEKYYDEWTENN